MGDALYPAFAERDSKKEFTKRDVMLIATLAAGVSPSIVAQFYGVSVKSIYNWIDKRRDVIAPMAEYVGTCLRTDYAKIRREAIDDYLGEIKKLDHLAMQTFINALQSDDKNLAYTAGKEQRDRRLGTPRSTVKHEGEVDVNHLHTHTLDKSVVEQLQRDTLRDNALMARRDTLLSIPAPSNVIDAEVIPRGGSDDSDSSAG